jgi:membrane peptidoglycan carboxypeptidase
MTRAFPQPSDETSPRFAILDRTPTPRRVRAGVLLVAVIAPTAILVGVVFASLGLGAERAARAVESRLLPHVGQPLSLPPLEQRSTIYASDGSVLERVAGQFDRKSVPLSKINATTIHTVLATEDARFFSHGAIDPLSLLRAAVADLKAGRFVEGGSTITQQLAKDVFTGDALTLTRKLNEASDAIRLQHTYSKRQILSAYLNEIYLGHGTYGIAAAGQYYFGTQPSKLTLDESALLAGLIRSPAQYDPVAHPVRAIRRRTYVLGRMRQLGWIGGAAYRRAVNAPLGLSIARRQVVASGPSSYWTQYVIQSFLSNPALGSTVKRRAQLLFQGGVRVYTTLDPALQRDAQRVLLRRMTGPGLPQSSLVSISPSTGAIVAMAVGNAPFGRSDKYNLAVDPGGGRTAGSAFKGFTLAAALESGISPNKVYNGDSPKTIQNCGGGQTWTLHNAEPGSGDYPLWLATADSVNTVFAQVINEVGPDAVARVATRMGITNPLVAVCPLTLGTSPVSPLQMTSGYATLADRGVHCQPYAISRVVSSDGQTIYSAKRECSRAIPASVADEETAILRGVIGLGTGTAANIGRPEAGKTGTGQNFYDAWFIGYVPQLATGVWVGQADAEIPMRSVPGYGEGFGGVLAAPIWHDYMLDATRNLPVRDFAPPPIRFGGPFGH